MLKLYTPSFFLVLISLFLLQACGKKTPPNGDAGTVQFCLNALVNSDSILLEAGKKNYYMYTNVYKAQDNILTCEGKLSSLTTDSNDAFTLLIKNYYGGSNPNLDSLFAIGPLYSYSCDTAPQVLAAATAVQFTFGGITQNLSGVEWNFGDGLTSTQLNPHHVYTEGGKKNVSVLVTYTTGQQDFLVNTIDVTPGSNCHAQFVITSSNTSDTIYCTASNGSGNYTWLLPDSTVQTGIVAMYTKPVLTRGYIQLQDNSACATAYQQVMAPKQVAALARFNYTIKDTSYFKQQTPNSNYAKAIVILKRHNKTYMSFKQDPLLHQSNKKIIELSSKKQFDNNAAGQPTMRLEGKLDTYLYNVANNSDSIYVSSKQLRIAVAFPQ